MFDIHIVSNNQWVLPVIYKTIINRKLIDMAKIQNTEYVLLGDKLMLFITCDIGLKKEINISSILFALCSIAQLKSCKGRQKLRSLKPDTDFSKSMYVILVGNPTWHLFH